jgi:hypothetical protein
MVRERGPQLREGALDALASSWRVPPHLRIDFAVALCGQMSRMPGRMGMLAAAAVLVVSA